MYKYLILLAIAASPLFSQGEVPEPIWTAKYNARDVAFSPDGNLLAIGNDDYKAYIVNSFTGEVLQELEHHDWSVNAVAFSPDGSQLVTINKGRRIIFWDTQTWEKRDSIYIPETDEYLGFGSTHIDFSPDGKYLAISASGWGFLIMDTETKEYRQWNDGPVVKYAGNGKVETRHGSYFTTFSYDNKYVMASFSGWKRVKIFDIETLEVVKEYKGAWKGEFNPTKQQHYIQYYEDPITKEFSNFLHFYGEDFDNKTDSIAPYISTNVNSGYSDNGQYFIYPKYLTFFDTGNLNQIYYNTEFKGGGHIFSYNEINGIITLGGVRQFKVNSHLSIEEPQSSSLIIIPNPTDSMINISYKFTNPTEFTIVLNDLAGNQLEILDSGFGNGNYQNQFDLSHLASGTYFLTLTVNGENITKQIVKE